MNGTIEESSGETGFMDKFAPACDPDGMARSGRVPAFWKSRGVNRHNTFCIFRTNPLLYAIKDAVYRASFAKFI